MADRTLWLNLPGEGPFVSGVVTSALGTDISTQTFEAAFGKRDALAPCTSWVAASVDRVLNATGTKVRIKVQVGQGGMLTLTPGVYRMWTRLLGDSTTSQVSDGLVTVVGG